MSDHLRKFMGPLFLSALLPVVAQGAAWAQRVSDAQIQSDAQKQLSNKRFSGIQVQVRDGIVDLTGQVARYTDKTDAEQKVQHMHEAASVRNDVTVAGGANVSDDDLYRKLAKGLVYDREGYRSQVFDNITVQVHNGVVLLGGIVADPVDKNTAVGLVKDTPGVRDLVDHLQVAPLSPADNRIRMAEERAIYGYPQLNRYALNPAKPIRIVVVNGHVTLEGAVDSKGDRDVAGLRANGVPGVFSVQNNLQVAGETER
jgi:osmotically-inducible protein OsmY